MRPLFGFFFTEVKSSQPYIITILIDSATKSPFFKNSANQSTTSRYKAQNICFVWFLHSKQNRLCPVVNHPCFCTILKRVIDSCLWFCLVLLLLCPWVACPSWWAVLFSLSIFVDDVVLPFLLQLWANLQYVCINIHTSGCNANLLCLSVQIYIYFDVPW